MSIDAHRFITMSDSSRFILPLVMLVSPFVIVSMINEGTGPQLGLAMICFSGIIFLSGLVALAYAAGKPTGAKRNPIALIESYSNPMIQHIPIQVQEDSKSQGVGAMMMAFTIVLVASSIFFFLIFLLSGMGSGLGGSGGTCDETCENMFALAEVSCYGSILMFAGGLVALARPWAFFMSDKPSKVVYSQPVENQFAQITTNVNEVEEDLDSLTVLELKARLKKLGRPVSGRKQELIDRLRNSTEDVVVNPPARQEEAQQGDKVEIACPECDRRLKVPFDYSGRVKCPSCANVFAR